MEGEATAVGLISFSHRFSVVQPPPAGALAGRRGELAAGWRCRRPGRSRVRGDDRIRIQPTTTATVLAACFITDLGTVIALGLISRRSLSRRRSSSRDWAAQPLPSWLTPDFFRRYGGRSELETKFLLLFLFGLGALAAGDSEAVLPAYVLGMILAGTVGKDTCWCGACVRLLGL